MRERIFLNGLRFSCQPAMQFSMYFFQLSRPEHTQHALRYAQIRKNNKICSYLRLWASKQVRT